MYGVAFIAEVLALSKADARGGQSDRTNMPWRGRETEGDVERWGLMARQILRQHAVRGCR